MDDSFDTGYTGDNSNWTSGWGVGSNGQYTPWSQDQSNFSNVGWEGAGGTGSSNWMTNNGYTTGGWDDPSSSQWSDPTKYAGDTGAVAGDGNDFGTRFRKFLTGFLANKVTHGNPLTGLAMAMAQAPEGGRMEAGGRALGSTVMNGLAGAIPGLGLINGLSGLFGGPTIGGAFNSIAQQGQPGEQGPPQSSGSNNTLGNLLTAGMSLYGYNKNTQGMDKTINGLQGMYGPNSAYSQQLQKSLERRDAAGGRRSQYGPRNVELQAKLAEMNSRNAPVLSQMYAQRNAQRDAGLNSLMKFGKDTGLFDKVGNSLGDMWSQMKYSNVPEVNSEWVYG